MSLVDMNDYIVANKRADKLRPWESFTELADGTVSVSTSSERDERGIYLQTLIDDLIVELGIAGARKRINSVLAEVIAEHQRV